LCNRLLLLAKASVLLQCTNTFQNASLYNSQKLAQCNIRGGAGARTYNHDMVADELYVLYRETSFDQILPNTQSLCYRALCLCPQRRSSKPDLFALPHARRRRQRNTCLSISLIYNRNVLLLVLVNQLVEEYVGNTSFLSFKVAVSRM